MREIGISPRFSRDKFVPLQTKQRYSTRDISGKVFLTLFFRGFVPFLSLADFVSRDKNLQVADLQRLKSCFEELVTATTRKGARLPFMSAGWSEATADARKADAAPRRNRTESALTEPEWKLDERITYKYFNDEVYPVSNSWRSVMYMEGPMSECVFLEKGDETEPDYEERIVCTRDASGKITAVNHTYSKETDSEKSSVYVVDAAGHVTRRTYTNKETSGDRTETYVEDNQYVWDSDRCVSMVETNGYTTEQQTKTSHVYTYDTAANKFTDELRITHENGTD